MSRPYSLGVTLEWPQDKIEAIQSALYEIVDLDPEDYWCNPPDSNGVIMAGFCTEISLCGGEEESEFAQRFAGIVWEAAGGFIPLDIRVGLCAVFPVG